MDRSTAQLRTTYIGGSDVAPIVGLGHFRSRIDVYMQKLGLGDEVEQNKAMKWGMRLEWQMLQILAEEEQLWVLGHDRDGSLVVFDPDGEIHPADQFRFPGNGRMIEDDDTDLLELWHPEFDYLGGHLDGIVYSRDGIVVGFADAKTTSFMRQKEWGDAGTDDIPQEYHFQFAHYSELLRLKLGRAFPCYVPVVIGGQDDRVFKVEHSEAMVADLYPILHEFWNDYVLAQVPPSAEPTELGKKALSKLYPADTGEVIETDDQLTKEAKFLKTAKQETKEAEAVQVASENRIKDRMESASRLEGDKWYITWKKNKDGKNVDWEAIARRMAADIQEELDHGGKTPTEDLDVLIAEHTTVKKGARPFLTKHGLKGLEA